NTAKTNMTENNSSSDQTKTIYKRKAYAYLNANLKRPYDLRRKGGVEGCNPQGVEGAKPPRGSRGRSPSSLHPVKFRMCALYVSVVKSCRNYIQKTPRRKCRNVCTEAGNHLFSLA